MRAPGHTLSIIGTHKFMSYGTTQEYRLPSLLKRISYKLGLIRKVPKVPRFTPNATMKTRQGFYDECRINFELSQTDTSGSLAKCTIKGPEVLYVRPERLVALQPSRSTPTQRLLSDISKYKPQNTPSPLYSTTVPPAAHTGITLQRHRVQLLRNCLKNLSFDISLYYQLRSNKPWRCVITSPANHLLHLLNTDIHTTWQIFGKNAIVGYAPEPSFVWLNGPWKSCQTVTGRGQILLAGNGSISVVTLERETDQVLVNEANILAINGLNTRDIDQAIENRYLDAEPYLPLQQVWKESLSTRSVIIKQMIRNSGIIFVNFWRWLQRLRTQRYVYVKGPRKIIIQTQPSKSWWTKSNVKSQELLLEHAGTILVNGLHSNNPVVHRATVHRGQVSFESFMN